MTDLLGPVGVSVRPGIGLGVVSPVSMVMIDLLGVKLSLGVWVGLRGGSRAPVCPRA